MGTATLQMPEPGQSKLGLRIVGGVIAVAIAVPAVAVQFDRQSRRDGLYAERVPGPFMGFAAARMVARDLDDGNTNAALIDARRMIAHRPIPAENLTLMALASVRADDFDTASEAMMLSAQRGWREILSQQLIISSAVASQSWDVASARLIALWSTNLGDQQVEELSQEVLSHPETQRAFGERLADKVRWQGQFLIWGARNLPTPAFVTTIRTAIDHGAQFDCAVLSAQAGLLVDNGQPQAAQQIWSGGCAAHSNRSPNSFAFIADKADQTVGPFDWKYPSYASFYRSFENESGKTLIGFRNTDPMQRGLAYKYATLAPGLHQAVVSARGGANGTLLLKVTCVDNSGKKVVLLSDDGRNGPIAFNVPEEGCMTQIVGLMAGTGQAQGIQLSID